MEKFRKKNLLVLFASVTLILASVVLSFNKSKNTNVITSEEEIVSSLEVPNKDFGLNYKEIKLRNDGDTFVVSVNINPDATIKSVSFTSDRSDCVSVTRLNNTSATLKRLKVFTGVVKITAKSNDPFVDLTDTCNVRCYNEITAVNDAFSSIRNEGNVDTGYLYNEGEIVLADNKTTHVVVNVDTLFGHLEEEESYVDGTFVQIEENDMMQFKNSLEEAITPLKISNFSQYENKYYQENKFEFDIVYNHNIFSSENKISKNVDCVGKKLELILIKYIAANSLDFVTRDVII